MTDKIEEPAPEQFLYTLWTDNFLSHRKFVAMDGRTIEVVHRGKRNFDSGPDFLDAHILISGRLSRGDIEIDPVANDWYSHGHHKNPLYNNVILQIVTMYCPVAAQTLRQDGTSIPILNLDHFLEKSSEKMADEQPWLAPGEQIGHCALASKDPFEIVRLVNSYGLARFRIKTARFSEERLTDSWEQIFYRALLEALGFSKNQIPFRRLANIVPIETLREKIKTGPAVSPILLAESYLFGMAGLLPSQRTVPRTTTDEKILTYVNRLESLWAEWDYKRKLDPVEPESWKFFRLRPQNFPTRRIAVAARIVIQFMDLGFLDSIVRLVTTAGKAGKKLASEIERQFQVTDEEGFWANHYSFDETVLAHSAKMELKLLGPERARNIVINSVLPIIHAYAEEAENYHLKNLGINLYSQYPKEAENSITRSLRRRILGDEKNRSKETNLAIHQQGFIHLAKNLCIMEDCNRCLRN